MKIKDFKKVYFFNLFQLKRSTKHFHSMPTKRHHDSPNMRERERSVHFNSEYNQTGTKILPTCPFPNSNAKIMSFPYAVLPFDNLLNCHRFFQNCLPYKSKLWKIWKIKWNINCQLMAIHASSKQEPTLCLENCLWNYLKLWSFHVDNGHP